MLTLKKALKSIDVHSWTSEKEVGEVLTSLIKLSGMKTVLETGVFRGQTSCYMINALPWDGVYYGIDVEDHRNAYVKHFMRSHKFILGDSRKELASLPENTFDLIFIDSVHEYEFLSVEFTQCIRVLKPKGVITLHDAYLPGVKQFIDEIRQLNIYEILTLDTVDQWGYNRGISIVKNLLK
jgi:predicted O-methyltransferase YrrM